MRRVKRAAYVTSAWLCTREDVMDALDVKSTARDETQIDRAIEAQSRQVEKFLARRFAPTLATRKFNWPNSQMGTPWDLWLDDNELISLTSLTSGGASIPVGNVFLEPVNYGPPFTRLSIDLSTSSAFSSGSTYQQSIQVTGLFGYTDDSLFAGTTVGTFDADFNTANIVVASVGVGSVLQIEAERLIVTDRNMTDTTRAITADLAASNAATLIQTDGATIYPGEVILIDAEKMLVTDITGNNLVVKRAWSGSVLGEHTNGAGVSANRALTVERGALGTTAEAHADGTTWTTWVVPGPVRTLTIAEVLNTFGQEQSGYARTVGSGDNARNASGGGLDDLRAAVLNSHGRKARTRTI